jgi:DNA topoisomerase I
MKHMYKKGKTRQNMRQNISPESTIVNTLNTPYLIIVESPSKCLKIEKFLGFQYKCIASKGHLREIKKVRNIEDYRIIYGNVQEKENHIQWMKSMIDQFLPQNIFLATDDDREGEAIAWHICELFQLSIETTKRILFHEVTEVALKHAVNSPITVRMNIVKAQQTRQILDRMIGFQISPILSRLIVHDNSKYLSAGRCQTPTLRLIYDRYKESESKTEKVQYKITGTFFSHPTRLEAQLDTYMESEAEVNTFLEASKVHNHVLSFREKISKHLNCPKPFSTSHLLQTASSSLHMSPKYTMDACQVLYQDGKITYMRTESQTYANGYLDQCKLWIENQFGDTFVGSFSKLMNNDAQNPHEAIRVTSLEVSSVNYTDTKVNRLYELIWKRSIESCMSAYEYEMTPILISAPDSQYKTELEIPLFLGWKRLSTSLEKMKESQMNISRDIEYFRKYLGKTIQFKKIESTLFMKDLEAYYHEASIIQKLEQLGIGRPSTYSMLVETIQTRMYVQKQNIEGELFSGTEHALEKDGDIQTKPVQKVFGSSKNKLKIQTLGIQSIEVLLKYFQPLFEYSYTREMEAELDNFIVDPDKSIVDVCRNCDEILQKCLDPLKEFLRKQYRIDENHRLMFGRNGMYIKCETDDIEGNTKVTSKVVKPNLEIDFKKLEEGEYTLEQIAELPNDCLGVYDGALLYLKKGPYGFYAQLPGGSVSVDEYAKSLDPSSITKEMVIEWINAKKEKPKKESPILREITKECAVRKGKYGNYIFYKTKAMKTPSFVNIKKCPYDVLAETPDRILKWVQESLKK